MDSDRGNRKNSLAASPRCRLLRKQACVNRRLDYQQKTLRIIRDVRSHEFQEELNLTKKDRGTSEIPTQVRSGAPFGSDQIIFPDMVVMRGTVDQLFIYQQEVGIDTWQASRLFGAANCKIAGHTHDLTRSCSFIRDEYYRLNFACCSIRKRMAKVICCYWPSCAETRVCVMRLCSWDTDNLLTEVGLTTAGVKTSIRAAWRKHGRMETTIFRSKGGSGEGRLGRSLPLKPTKVTSFTTILCNCAKGVCDMRLFCAVHCFVTAVLWNILHLSFRSEPANETWLLNSTEIALPYTFWLDRPWSEEHIQKQTSARKVF